MTEQIQEDEVQKLFTSACRSVIEVVCQSARCKAMLLQSGTHYGE